MYAGTTSKRNWSKRSPHSLRFQVFASWCASVPRGQTSNLAYLCADRVDNVLADMDAHNRALAIQVAAAEAAHKPCALVVYESPNYGNARAAQCHRDHPAQVLSVTVQVEPSLGVSAPDDKESMQSRAGAATASTSKTPKAALRKRLLEARTALGGVKLGDAPKRSISFHPSFPRNVCDDDLV